MKIKEEEEVKVVYEKLQTRDSRWALLFKEKPLQKTLANLREGSSATFNVYLFIIYVPFYK